MVGVCQGKKARMPANADSKYRIEFWASDCEVTGFRNISKKGSAQLFGF
jgi:hypothetical protein